MSECAKPLGCHLLIDATRRLVGPDQRQAIYERLLQRNAIRSELGIRRLNIPELYRRKKRMIAEARYDEIMEPYVDSAFKKIDWPDSFTGRILLGVRTYRDCAAQCERETGYANPRDGAPDILKLIHQHVAPLN
jgi:hypothetical protein